LNSYNFKTLRSFEFDLNQINGNKKELLFLWATTIRPIPHWPKQHVLATQVWDRGSTHGGGGRWPGRYRLAGGEARWGGGLGHTDKARNPFGGSGKEEAHQRGLPTVTVTPSFKTKTKCIPLCVPRGKTSVLHRVLI
jgi:hypothetical protein